MKEFVSKVVVYLFLILMVIALAIMLPDYGNRQNILYGLPKKHEQLAAIESPKMVFVGGSNLNFGLDSKTIQDSLQTKIFNLSIHAGLGLKFMLEEVKPFIKSKDTIILSPEYSHFYDDSGKDFYGSDELLTVVFDVKPALKKLIPFEQWLQLVKNIPNYTGRKYFNFLKYFFKEKRYPVFYRSDSFNEYGDLTQHWDLPVEQNNPKRAIDVAVLEESIVAMKSFQKAMLEKEATVYIAPASFQQSSFKNRQAIIQAITDRLKQEGFVFLNDPKVYAFEDSLFFNSVYHLTGEGVKKRADLLINDLRNVRQKK